MTRLKGIETIYSCSRYFFLNIEYYDPTKGDWNDNPLVWVNSTTIIEYYDPTKGDWNAVISLPFLSFTLTIEYYDPTKGDCENCVPLLFEMGN